MHYSNYDIGYEKSIGQQILSGCLIAGWLLFLPLIWTYKGVRWTLIAVFKETRQKMITTIASLLTLIIIATLIQLLTGK